MLSSPHPPSAERTPRSRGANDEVGGKLNEHPSFATVNLRAAALPALPEDIPDADLQATHPVTPSRLFGDYEILSEVGRGGMGVVFQARHRSLNRIVALKVCHRTGSHEPHESRRFHLEAAAVARLDHPNIVPIYESGEVNGSPFYSMAFVEGENLARAVSRSPLPPRRAAELMQVVAGAIAYAHAQGVIHRDLKPDNILLDVGRGERSSQPSGCPSSPGTRRVATTLDCSPPGRPRITDFGVARFLGADSHLTRSGEVIGTPSYMPPEQAQGGTDRVGPAADVYSLGATLYCLLTGRPPFQAATTWETFTQVVVRDPVSPRQLNPAVDLDLETICLKCLEKNPTNRYGSALALAGDLERFLEGRSIQARPIGPVHKGIRWCRRNPLPAALAASVVAVFLAAFVLVSWSYWRAEEALEQEADQRQQANQARDDAIRHEQAERWERYRANLAAISSSFQSENFGGARRTAESTPTEHRNWEWRYFNQRLDQSQRSWPALTPYLRKILFLGPDKVVTADDGKEAEQVVGVLDLATGVRSRKFSGKHRASRLMTVSPDGRLFACPTPNNTIVLEEVPSGRLRATLRDCDKPIRALQFSPDSRRLVSFAEDEKVHVWDTSTGRRLRCYSARIAAAERLSISAGPGFLLHNGLPGGVARLLEAETGRLLADLTGHTARISAVAFSHRTNRVVTAEEFPSNLMRLWDARTGQQIAVLSGHGNQLHSVEFSPDGDRISSSSYDQTVRLWDGRTGKPIATLRGHTGHVFMVAFSPDSKRLVSGSQDHTLRIWDGRTGERIAILCGHQGDVGSVAWSPDGARLVSGGMDGALRLWDARLAERNGILRGHTSFVYGVAFHPDGRHVSSVAWDGTVRIWDATLGRQRALMKYPKPTFITALDVHPTGKWLATLGRDDSVRLWDVGTARQLHCWNVPTNWWRDCRLAFSPKGDLLASGSKSGDVYLFDVQERSRVTLLRGHREAVADVVFSRDGTWLASAGSRQDGIRIWDLATKKQIHTLEGHTANVCCLAVLGDGSLLASGSQDGTVRLWDTKTWKESGVLKHGTSVYGLAFNPDRSRLATACADKTIRFWDVGTRQEVAELHGHDDYVHSLAFSPDGARLVSGSGDGTVRIWDTLSPAHRAALESREAKAETQLNPRH